MKALLVCLLLSGCCVNQNSKQDKVPTIDWYGSEVTIYNPEGAGYLSDTELGLRDDGVLVWRIKKSTE